MTKKTGKRTMAETAATYGSPDVEGEKYERQRHEETCEEAGIENQCSNHECRQQDNENATRLLTTGVMW
jgi:hypothetical protein